MLVFCFSVLASLNLPAALEDTSGNSLPQSLVDKALSVRSNGGIQVLERMMRELPDLLQRNKDILDEVMLSVSTCLLSVTFL
jgi:programmed cell death 6-interacting protein